MLWNPRPAYPAEARRQGWEGIVKVRLKVGSDGRVIEARVATSSSHATLDQAALSALQRWRFAPRSLGSSVQEFVQEVVFRLDPR